NNMLLVKEVIIMLVRKLKHVVSAALVLAVTFSMSTVAMAGEVTMYPDNTPVYCRITYPYCAVQASMDSYSETLEMRITGKGYNDIGTYNLYAYGESTYGISASRSSNIDFRGADVLFEAWADSGDYQKIMINE
ncbi:MAG: hypothetical protein Q4F11_10615, partial [Eubacteriales bacterium]|nr:hypothetical protein [Eubacteriales bacterium]